MHGWMEEYWWMTALPQGCSRFRENYGEEIKACAVYKNGERKFFSYDKIKEGMIYLEMMKPEDLSMFPIMME